MEKKQKIVIGIVIAMQVVLAVGIVLIGVQNNSLAQSLKEYTASTGDIHEIYDDTKVVEAYSSGSDEGLNEQDKYVLKMAKKVIDENIEDGMTDYEKEKAIYDWLVDYTSYSSQNLAPISSGDQYSHLPYGVFKYHQAICVGNATTMKLFLDILGIENQIIHSTEEGEHAWNLVKLDGDWYHCDVTFDGSVNGTPNYSYFNVPDSVKDDGNYPWDHEAIPAADGTKYCYIANNAKEVKNVYALPKYLQEQIDSGAGQIYFTMKDTEDFTTAALSYILSAFSMEGKDVYNGGTLVIGDKTLYSVSVDQYVDMDGQLDPDVQEKLQKAMDKLGLTGSDMGGYMDDVTSSAGDGQFFEYGDGEFETSQEVTK